MARPRKGSKAYYAKINYFRGIAENPVKEYNDIWHWIDKSKRRFRIEKVENRINILINLKDTRSESHKLLDKFEIKWHVNIKYSDDMIRQDIRNHLSEYPNKNTTLPKKKFFERNKAYQKRCNDFKRVSIEPSDDIVNNEFTKRKADQHKAINSDEYKQLQDNVKRQILHVQEQNKKRYLDMIEIQIFDDDNDMKNVWAEIRECCEKDDKLKEHYLSLQVNKEKAWFVEREKKKLLKEDRAKLREKQKAEKKAMLARANKESRQLGAKIKFRLRRDHNCPYCNEELGMRPHADHIIPIAQGGLSVKHNMVNVCEPCNLAKSDLTLFEFTQKKDLDYMAIISTLRKLGKRI